MPTIRFVFIPSTVGSIPFSRMVPESGREAYDHAERRGFTCTIGSQETVDFTGSDVQIQISDCQTAAMGFCMFVISIIDGGLPAVRLVGQHSATSQGIENDEAVSLNCNRALYQMVF